MDFPFVALGAIECRIDARCFVIVSCIYFPEWKQINLSLDFVDLLLPPPLPMLSLMAHSFIVYKRIFLRSVTARRTMARRGVRLGALAAMRTDFWIDFGFVWQIQ